MKITKITKGILSLTMVMISFGAFALSSTHFATTSKLAAGKWAKVKVGCTGVYEITAEELSQLGFSDISKIKVFGRGGAMLSEVLSESLPDDISQIPAYITDDKVIFYAQGAVNISANATSSRPYHTGVDNTYSKYGYYFITDDARFQSMEVTPATDDSSIESSVIVRSCYDYVYYNNNIFSFLNSGKTFYGENLLDDYDLTFKLPNYVEETPLTLAFSIGSNVDAATTVSAAINGTDIPLSSNKLSKIGSYHEFETCSPVGTSSEVASADSYSLKINIQDTGINNARLDFYSVTYQKTTDFPADSTQMRMAFASPNLQWNITVGNATGDVVVWDVTGGTPKIQHLLTAEDGEVAFVPTTVASWEKYVAFKPAETLKKVIVEGLVENQNLHGSETPDMVIIYPKNFKSQAKRLADLHHSHDGFDVLIAEEEAVFNEFSAGTPDATAYRLLMKMFYDRNPEKMKYLLLLGCGSYDNRKLSSEKSENQLLTYQSNDSYGTVSSYVTDDYFGILSDNSGKSLPTDVLTISVGRISAKTVEDAENAIAKTLDYIISDNDEVWRSNVLLVADKGDNNLHTTQAEGTEDVIETALGGNSLNIGKIYQEWYTKSNLTENVGGTENWGRNKLETQLKEGVLFMSYIGHAGPIALTRGDRIWTSAKVRSIKYPYIPFISLSACETARFDDDGRCISEEFILAQDGGAIGVLSAARTVYSAQNDKLNKALSQYLFTLKEDGSYRTIGEAAMEAKKTFGTSYNYNKLSFTLFGDPALRFRFPVNLCKVTAINGTATTEENISISPMTTVSVEGVVNTPTGEVDTSFNGDVTVTLYDAALKYKDLPTPSNDATYSVSYPREKLCHSSAQVVEGKFKVNITLPKSCVAAGEQGLITVFAKSEDDRIVSGSEGDFAILAYDGSDKLNDTKAPEISRILIDGHDAKDMPYVSSNPVISIMAIDDVAINTKPGDIGGAMKLIIDNGKETVTSLSNYMRASHAGKNVSGNVALHNLPVGKHTVYVEVSDVAGNSVSREAVFYVINENLDCVLTVAEDVVREQVEIELETEYDIADCSLYVRDNAGNTVLVKEIGGSSYTWDLKDSEGNRVSPGRYTLYASFSGENGLGTTAPINVVVLKQ